MAATNLVRPAKHGKPMITIEEAQVLVGLSVWRLRERTSKRSTRRGGFIRSLKVGTRLYFDQDELLEDVYGKNVRPLGTKSGAKDDDDFIV